VSFGALVSTYLYTPASSSVEMIPRRCDAP
jgi:hypothetical protein